MKKQTWICLVAFVSGVALIVGFKIVPRGGTSIGSPSATSLSRPTPVPSKPTTKPLLPGQKASTQYFLTKPRFDVPAGIQVFLARNGKVTSGCAGKANWDGKKWVKQVVAYNSAAPPLTHPVWQYVIDLEVPTTPGTVLYLDFGRKYFRDDGVDANP